MNNLNVFVDFHHASLLNSLILLFEKRLEGNVYRPIGTEWFEKGFWKIYDHPATVEQFLGINGATPDGTPRLNDVEKVIGAGDGSGKSFIYQCHDIDSGQNNKAITFEGFINTPIDIVIASLPQHVEPFKRLCELHPDKPKLIYQIGNQWDFENEKNVKNFMVSAKINNTIPDGVNVVEYHQEFDLNIFKPSPLPPENIISSFVNCFNIDGMFTQDWELFQKIESRMPDWKFRSYGGQCRDGAIGPSDKLAKYMNDAKFIWHTKNGGDGYGHIIHNAAACGKPMIVKKSYYSGKLGENLMIDGLTCIDIDGLNPTEIVDKILYYSDPARYSEMCEAVKLNFRIEVDFDKEFQYLKSFLSELL